MDPWLFRRISVRHLVSEQATDVIGRVIHRSDTLVHLMRRDGQIEVVPIQDIIAAREVPDDNRRLRSVSKFPESQLSPMVKRILGACFPPRPVWVSNIHELPTVVQADVVHLGGQPDAPFTQIADSHGLELAGPELPELTRAFLRTEAGSIARVILVGDWMTIEPVFAPPGPARGDELLALFHVAISWARERGAVYAWMLPDPSDSQFLTVLQELGFVPHSDASN